MGVPRPIARTRRVARTRHVARTRCAATGTPDSSSRHARPSHSLSSSTRIDSTAVRASSITPADRTTCTALPASTLRLQRTKTRSPANIPRARHDGPALGDIGGGVRPGRRADLEHVARRHIAVEPHPRALKPGFVDATDFEPLVDGALDAHEPRAGGRMAAEQVPVGEPPAKGPGELGLERIELRLPSGAPASTASSARR